MRIAECCVCGSSTLCYEDGERVSCPPCRDRLANLPGHCANCGSPEVVFASFCDHCAEKEWEKVQRAEREFLNSCGEVYST